jgi:hypothetical protein
MSLSLCLQDIQFPITDSKLISSHHSNSWNIVETISQTKKEPRYVSPALAIAPVFQKFVGEIGVNIYRLLFIICFNYCHTYNQTTL